MPSEHKPQEHVVSNSGCNLNFITISLVTAIDLLYLLKSNVHVTVKTGQNSSVIDPRIQFNDDRATQKILKERRWSGHYTARKQGPESGLNLAERKEIYHFFFTRKLFSKFWNMNVIFS